MVVSHLPRSICLNETAEPREKLFICNKLDAGIFFSHFRLPGSSPLTLLESFKNVDIRRKTGLCSKATKDLALSPGRTWLWGQVWWQLTHPASPDIRPASPQRELLITWFSYWFQKHVDWFITNGGKPKSTARYGHKDTQVSTPPVKWWDRIWVLQCLLSNCNLFLKTSIHFKDI